MSTQPVICPNCKESSATIKAVEYGFRFSCLECKCYWMEKSGISNAKRKPIVIFKGVKKPSVDIEISGG